MNPRLFFAVPIDDGAVRAIERLQSSLRERMGAAKLSYCLPSQAHVTLKFLGDVDEDRRAPLVAACEPLKKLVAPFELTLAGKGAFPDASRPRVLWTGVSKGAAELERLAHGVDAATEPLGFAREARAFFAHLTLARVKARGAEAVAARALLELPSADLATFDVRCFVLMQSTHASDGVRYLRVHTFDLEG
jgi:2'-5' RNA ligase